MFVSVLVLGALGMGESGALGMTESILPVAYGLGKVDLAGRWQKLVEDGSVRATTEDLTTYGVVARGMGYAFEVVGTSEQATRLKDSLSQSSKGLRTERDGDFFAQLQLVRTLRPARAFSKASGERSCEPPAYAPGSLVAGPLRLQLRPRAAEVSANGRPWDCFHNVSPCDPRGHFLLLPSLDDRRTWRSQALTRDDCSDICALADPSVVVRFRGRSRKGAKER